MDDLQPIERLDLPVELQGLDAARMTREEFHRHYVGEFPQADDYREAKHQGDPRYDTHYWHPQHGWAPVAPMEWEADAQAR